MCCGGGPFSAGEDWGRGCRGHGPWAWPAAMASNHGRQPWPAAMARIHGQQPRPGGRSVTPTSVIHMFPDVQNPPGKKGQRFSLLNGKPKTNMVPNVQNHLGEKSPAFPPFECSRMVPVLRGAQRQTHKRIHMRPDVQKPPPPGKKGQRFPVLNGQEWFRY